MWHHLVLSSVKFSIFSKTLTKESPYYYLLPNIFRVFQDAHNCILDFDEDTSLFAVYDGHGGSEVAVYTSERFPEFLRNTDNFKKNLYKEALIEAFLGFDGTIVTADVLKYLKELAKDDQDGKSSGNKPYGLYE